MTITGTGFTGATAVDFGTIAASQFHNQLGHADHGHEPGGVGGTVDVTVVTPRGTSPASSADQFSYVARTRGDRRQPGIGFRWAARR